MAAGVLYVNTALKDAMFGVPETLAPVYPDERSPGRSPIREAVRQPDDPTAPKTDSAPWSRRHALAMRCKVFYYSNIRT